MNINLEENWQRIRTHFSTSFASNMYVSIASVDEESSTNDYSNWFLVFER